LLLLPAREVPSAPLQHPLQRREQLEHERRNRARAILAHAETDAQILLDRQLRENLASLGDVPDAETGATLGWMLAQIGFGKPDLAGRCWQQWSSSSLLADDPLQRFALVTLVVGSCLRMYEDSKRANQPMLPVMRGDDRYALDLLLVVFDEPGMGFKSPNILPAMESGRINQQSDLPMLTNERVDLRRNLAEVVSVQFIRQRDPQRIA
jgi:hypothetical protein